MSNSLLQPGDLVLLEDDIYLTTFGKPQEKPVWFSIERIASRVGPTFYLNWNNQINYFKNNPVRPTLAQYIDFETTAFYPWNIKEVRQRNILPPPTVQLPDI